MAIRIKVDEDLPNEVAHVLSSAGHDARTVVEQGLTGAADELLWNVVEQERRWLFTADKGFASAEAFPLGVQGGIVLLRLRRESRAGYVRLTELLLKDVNVETASGSIIVVTPDTIRIHRGGRQV